MLLIEIDKGRYRRHLNIVLATCIAFLMISSLAIAQLLIALFPAEQGTHFHWNLLGVILSVLIVVILFKSNKQHPFLHEIVYVLELKHALNLISRKMTKLQQAAKMGDSNALLVLQFSYTGSRKLWLLDDNTITLDSLDSSQAELDALLQKYAVSVDISRYNSALLSDF